MEYLSIEALQVSYRQNNQHTPALKDLSLSLPFGSIGVLIGPSGCGKSTLLSVLADLNRNYQGTVLINGRSPQECATTALLCRNTVCRPGRPWG